MWFLKASKVTKVVRMPNGFYVGRNLKKVHNQYLLEIEPMKPNTARRNFNGWSRAFKHSE